MKTVTLHRLTPQGRRALVEWYRSADEELSLTEAHTQVTEQARLDLEALAKLGGEIRSAYEAGAHGIDAMLAPGLHEAMPLGRRLAADPRLWGWFGVDRVRDLLEYRWPRKEGRGNPHRYDGKVSDHGLARLWWAAELTRSDGDGYAYQTTHLLVRNPYLLDRLLSARILRSRVVMQGTVDALQDTTRWKYISETTKRLQIVASTVCLEALSRSEIADLVAELRDQAIASVDRESSA